MKLYLDFNSSLEFVTLKLQGDGTLIIDTMKKEHKDALIFEILNLILDYKPRFLYFGEVKNESLINLLKLSDISYDSTSGRLKY